MDFGLTAEQELLQTTARDVLSASSPTSHVREMEGDPRGYSPRLWMEMAKLGWLGLAYPEEHGGVGLGLLELALTLEEMGRRLVPGPFLGSVLCGSAIVDAGDAEQQKRFLPALMSGETIVVPALYESARSPDATPRKTRAARSGSGYRLDGVKRLVEFGHVADWLLVPAANADGAVSLFLVRRDAPGLGYRAENTIAGGRYTEVTLNGVDVGRESLLGPDGGGDPTLRRLMSRGAAGLAAWMVGGAQWVLDTTVEYAKQRVQFDQPIGSFQAIQHRCANMQVECDVARFLAYQAAWRLAEGLPAEREVAMAKGRAGEAYKRVCFEAHQVHGAIGFTWEYDLQLYTRRAKPAELLFGDAQWHRERVADSLELEGAAG
jgi:alkylation response protein AidB-like acyl-CoA dehydrogenase